MITLAKKTFFILKAYLLSNWRITVIFSPLFSIFIINQLHVSYPDEFENILGGYNIVHGLLPYRDFFGHHNPFAYFFAAPIAVFSGQSFVKFRLILGVVYFLMSLSLYYWIKRRFDAVVAKITLAWLFIIALGATYWWGHLLLADSLSGYLLVVPVMLLFWVILRQEALTKKDLWVISLLSFATVMTTFTLLFSVLVIYLFTIIVFFKNTPFFKKTLRLFAIFLIPYLFYATYLFFTGSLQEYFYQAIFFTSKYYANLPDNVSTTNPLRMMVVLAYHFFTGFKAALTMTKDLNFGNPFMQTLVLADTIMLIYLTIEKKYLAAVFLAFVLMFSMARSSPYTTTETDYHGIPYQLMSAFFGLVVLWFLWNKLQDKLIEPKKMLYFTFFLSLGIYFFFFTGLLLEKFVEKTYLKYMGKQSLIYDRPPIAGVVNGLLDKNDYYFIGPFALEDHLYINARLASKYIVVIPAMDQSEKIQQELLNDLGKHPVKMIVYNTEYRIFGTKPGGFIQGWLRNNYFNLEEMGAPCLNYKAVTKWFGDYDFERHFFFAKDKKDQLIKQLFDNHLIEAVDPTDLPAFCVNNYPELSKKKLS